MKFEDISTYAIEYARDGFPVGQINSADMAADVDKLRKFAGASKIYLKQNEPYKQGEILRNEDYAKSLEILGSKGEQAFYKGEIAEK